MKFTAPIWMWLNILSLDAPIVAVVWQDFLARCYPSMLRPSGRVVLGLTVWAIYLADRLIDVRRPALANESIRHRFYREHPRFATMLLLTVVLADALAATLWLRPAVFANGLITLIAVACYLWIFGLLKLELLASKKTAAALLFAAGVFAVATTGKPGFDGTLAGFALSFAALCFANLVMIEKWELGAGLELGWAWMFLLAAVCGSLGVFAQSSWYSAIAWSALALGVLDRLAHILSQNVRRVLADAVLLTPLLFR